jgi:hypothetical protein
MKIFVLIPCNMYKSYFINWRYVIINYGRINYYDKLEMLNDLWKLIKDDGLYKQED